MGLYTLRLRSSCRTIKRIFYTYTPKPSEASTRGWTLGEGLKVELLPRNWPRQVLETRATA